MHKWLSSGGNWSGCLMQSATHRPQTTQLYVHYIVQPDHVPSLSCITLVLQCWNHSPRLLVNLYCNRHSVCNPYGNLRYNLHSLEKEKSSQHARHSLEIRFWQIACFCCTTHLLYNFRRGHREKSSGCFRRICRMHHFSTEMLPF